MSFVRRPWSVVFCFVSCPFQLQPSHRVVKTTDN
jgi:hypothetical protein